MPDQQRRPGGMPGGTGRLPPPPPAGPGSGAGPGAGPAAAGPAGWAGTPAPPSVTACAARQAGTPSGQAGTPSGQAGTPTGQAGTLGGQAGTPGGQAGTAAGQAGGASSIPPDPTAAPLTPAADLLPSVTAAEGRRRDQGPGREILGQRRDRHGQHDGWPAAQPGRSGFTPALQLSYDSAAGNGPFGFGWSLGPAGDHPQDRQGPAAVPRRRRVGRLHPGRRRGPGAGARPGGRAADADHGRCTAPPYQVAFYRPRDRGAVLPDRALDRGGHRAQPLADAVPRQRHHAVRRRPGQPDRRPRRPGQDLLLADLPELGRQGQRRPSTATSPRTAPGSTRPRRTRPTGPRRPAPPRSTSRRSSTGTSSPTSPTGPPQRPRPAARRLDVHRGPRLRRPRQRAATPAARPALAAAPRPVLDLPRRVRGPDLPARAAAAVLQQLPRRADGRARLPGRARSTWPTPTSRRRPIPRNPIYTFLVSVTQTGYRQGDQRGLVTRSMPPLEFSYSQPQIQPEILTLDPDSLANLPEGLDGGRFRWVDLDGEGLSGILSDAGGGWYYKRNLSAGQPGRPGRTARSPRGPPSGRWRPCPRPAVPLRPVRRPAA